MNQSGRSMIEMLGVLAIVGVLSVGALAGYSMAMTNHKVNTLSNDINRIVMGILETYSTMPAPRDHTVITRDFLVDAGLLPVDYLDPWGREIKTAASNHTIMVRYDITNPSICRKLLSNSSFQETGNNLAFITINDDLSFFSDSWGMSSPNNPFPLTVGEINTVCGNAEFTYGIVIAVYIKGGINTYDFLVLKDLLTS